MPWYFASDIHLRADRPERGQRLARWVRGLSPGTDHLYVVGDLCDFWFASRQRHALDLPCDGLRSLAEFVRHGGRLTILPGNHDAWLGDYYREALGAEFIDAGRIELRTGNLRILATHGHLLGARSAWKHAMESLAFLKAFHFLPRPAASCLATILDRNNDALLEARHRKYLDLYRRQVQALAGEYDLVILGHVHQTADFADMSPRLIVLGHWHQNASYLRIDEREVSFIIERTTRQPAESEA